MRELSECTAEVFRRSDERIKKIKNVRKRVLTVCVPLCLFAMVMSAVLLPSALNTAKKSENGSNSSYYCSIVKAEIKGAGGSRPVEDVNEAINIYFAVYHIFNDGEDKEEPSATENVISDEAEELYGAEESTSGIAENEYVIAFYTAEGYESVYTLCTNVLTDRATGETLTLTDEQTETLRGMIDAKEE